MLILLNLVSNPEITRLITFWLVLNYNEYVFSYEIWKPNELSECLVLPVNSNKINLTEKGRERKSFVVSNPTYEKTPPPNKFISKWIGQSGYKAERS